MVNLLETLYVVTALSVLIATLAWVQSRGGAQRAERYGRRMRIALVAAALSAIAAAVLYWRLSA
jgi:hypothetical protein